MKYSPSPKSWFLRISFAAQLLLISLPAMPQSAIRHSSDVSFVRNHSNKNLQIQHAFGSGRSTFQVGICFLLKKEPRDAVYAYQNRAYPQNFFEHLGLQLGYRLKLLQSKTGFELYSFFDSQCTRPSLLLKYYYPTSPQLQLPNNFILQYAGYVHQKLPPQPILESNVGFGVSIPVVSNLRIHSSGGLGIFLTRRPFRINNSRLDFEGILPYLRVGIQWVWSKPVGNKTKADL